MADVSLEYSVANDELSNNNKYVVPSGPSGTIIWNFVLPVLTEKVQVVDMANVWTYRQQSQANVHAASSVRSLEPMQESVLIEKMFLPEAAK